MKLFLFLPGILCAIATSAQSSTVITVKAGEDMSILYQHAYRYPSFLPGKVYFTNDSARALFNYNLLDGRIEFIGDKKDTLLIADESSVRQVIIEKDSFFFHNGNYLRSVGDYGFARLLIKESLKLLDEKNIGSYGVSRPTHTIESRRTLLSLQTMTLQLNKDLVFSKEADFFFSSYGKYFTATRKNILKQLNDKEKKLAEDFISAQALDLKKERDLQKLFQYIFTTRKL